ncbi:hypothetical protein N7489_007200 [Penicillium chrysogenum]|jgi:hypothetical protein|uniref:Uncharacterized protein n=1 Tax=Penicillium chrysogenum TaxID=5076 RepID=A0ABQ8W5U0_PENCH|nr:uncharacterized protein N7489_007200 [Penicillium chrysogenum]KAJ5237109.1 hypothetical protein N7489_007200 [Penicillium chrysogenum]KAJ5256043.1 hypothetical protein N7505_011194 [Penicillium chrysogenum]KAJ6152186.1 hypothetical protein N7497_006505 [Penicillium chrysogenum]
MKRTAPSPKRRGLFRHEPRQLNPQLSELCPEAINVSPASATSMIADINSDHSHRHLAFQTASDQLELLRLEALRLKITESTRSKSNPAAEMPYQCATSVPTQNLGSNGEPGPTVPNSTRTSIRSRAAVLSESEISVLDLGPSLHSTHISAGVSRRNSSSTSSPIGVNLTRTTVPNFVPGPGSDASDQPVEHRLRIDELESEVLTSASGSVNEFLNLRQRRQNRPNANMPNAKELRPSRVNRSSSISEVHTLRDGSGFERSPTSFSDEPVRRIFSLSVPQSPQSPGLPPQPILRRAQSSFNGMDPAFSAMRNAERAKRCAREAVGSRDADRK